MLIRYGGLLFSGHPLDCLRQFQVCFVAGNIINLAHFNRFIFWHWARQSSASVVLSKSLGENQYLKTLPNVLRQSPLGDLVVQSALEASRSYLTPDDLS